jgi:hypothetical protein
MLHFWEIIKMACDSELKDGDRFESDAGIMVFNNDSGIFIWEDDGESVVAMRDDLRWEEI